MKTFLFPVILILLFPSLGAAYCFEPTKPFCVEGFGKFSSQSEYQICKRDLELYLDEMADYARCLARDIEEKQEGAIDEFNRRVTGYSF